MVRGASRARWDLDAGHGDWDLRLRDRNLETSYANRLARLVQHPADRPHEDDQQLWRDALAAAFGPQVAKAAVLIQQYMTRYPDNRNIRLLHARNLAQRRHFEAAAAEFRALEFADPADDRWRKVWLNEWVELCELRRDEASLEASYRELVTFEPDHTEYWILLGACLARQGKLEEAIEMHRRATGLEGDPDEAFLNLGVVLRALGRLEEAADAFVNALALCPDYPDASDALADVREAIRLRDGDGA